MRSSTWAQRLHKKREGKDRFFKEHPQSPIPPWERKAFKGLSYYPVDPSYRFELALHEYAEKRLVRVKTTNGGERDLVRWGEFRFEADGEEHTLQAFRTDPDAGRLFVPFRDETSGNETYAEGRYLDLEPEIHRTPDGRWVVDFNEAYNPWCEYSDAFECPFAPRENSLRVRVRAGEKRLAS